MVARALERARLVSLPRKDTRKLTAVEGVRRQTQQGRRGTRSTFQVRLRLRSWTEMVQQVAALMEQVMDMSEGLRPNRRAALVAAHRNAGQILEDRVRRAEATVAAASQSASGSGAGKSQASEVPGADDGRFGFGALPTRELPWRRRNVARLVHGVSDLGWTVPTGTSGSHTSSGGLPFRRGPCRSWTSSLWTMQN